MKSFAQEQGWTLEKVAATKAFYLDHVEEFLLEDERYRVKKLLALSGITFRLSHIAFSNTEKGREEGDTTSPLLLLAKEWSAKRLMFPLLIQSWASGKKDEFGRKKTSGLKGFLAYELGKRTIVDSEGVTRIIPAALRRAESIHYLFEAVFEPLGIATLYRNGRRKTTSCSIDNLLGLYIFADLLAELIEKYSFKEAVPDWHPYMNYDLKDLLKGAEEGDLDLDEAAIEVTEEKVIPSVKQDPLAIFATDSPLAKKLIKYCCKRTFTEVQGGCNPMCQAAITVCGKVVKYGVVAKKKVFTFAQQVKAIAETAALTINSVVEEVVQEGMSELDCVFGILEARLNAHLLEGRESRRIL